MLNSAKEFIQFLKPNEKIGLGTGQTVEALMDLVYQMDLAAKLNLQFCYTSKRTEKLAIKYGFLSLNEFKDLDLVVDGADIILENGWMIKGKGGALFQEKIIAGFTKKYFIIADAKKLRKSFDKQIIPIEISPINYEDCLTNILAIGGNPEIRLENGNMFKTDNQNFIADTYFETVPEPRELASKIKLIAGVIDHGLFLDFKPILILGSENEPTKIIYT